MRSSCIVEVGAVIVVVMQIVKEVSQAPQRLDGAMLDSAVVLGC